MGSGTLGVTMAGKLRAGDLVRHVECDINSFYGEERPLGLVVGFDGDSDLIVQVVWLPIIRGNKTKTFHHVESLERYDG